MVATGPLVALADRRVRGPRSTHRAKAIGSDEQSLFLVALGAERGANGRLASYGSYNGIIDRSAIYSRAFAGKALVGIAGSPKPHDFGSS